MHRRRFLHCCAACAGTLVAGGAVSGCLPETTGPEDVHYDRDVCEICRMIISDPRFATEIRGGPRRKVFKFDDIGDALHWLTLQPWKDAGDVEIWVMDYPTGETWLDARTAHYRRGVISPMDYGFGAVPEREPGAVDFATMRREVLDMGLSGRVERNHGAGQE